MTEPTTPLPAQLETAIRTAVEARKESLFELTAELVRQQTLTGQEEGAQRIIDARLRAAGFAVERVQPDAEAALADPYAGYPALSYEGRSSVVGRSPGSGGGRSLHLNGHVDVVPVERPEEWAHDPWGAEIADGRLWGRGSGDMKAGLAACIVAAEVVAEVCPDRAGELIVSSVIEEETGGNGMWSVLRAGHVGDATVFGEPSDLCLDHGGTGVVWAKLTAHSSSGHAETAKRSGAFEELAAAVAALRRLEKERNSPPRDPAFAAVSDWPFGTSIGKIEGGVWTASTPERLAAHARIGFGRETEPAEVQQEVVEAVAAATDQVTVEFTAFRARAYCHDSTGPWPDAVAAAHRTVVGTEPQTTIATATADARYITGPSLCYGPITGNLHGRDEWVDLASLEQVAGVIALAAAAWTS
ncbi:MAG: M20/M25/M40 family metallo-hydrolase [Actinobacteria bacterium]|nr:M20/M25/M40 family metallo-hydrolase [Actinomycetota bacterium]